MTRRYISFSKQKFEYELVQYKKRGVIPYYIDTTEKLIASGNYVEEYVYVIPNIVNKHVNILIYSSVDIGGGRVRKKGGDAVRIVLVWNMGGKRYYKKFKTHYRISTLFQNMEKSIILAQEICKTTPTPPKDAVNQ